MDFMLPESKQRKTINLSLTDEQKELNNEIKMNLVFSGDKKITNQLPHPLS